MGRTKLQYVGGVDEAGRGPLAGPVTAAAVVLKPCYKNSGITDSKQLSAEDREELFPEIQANSLAYAIVSVGHRRIEQLNIREATRLAMSLAMRRVQQKLVEYNPNSQVHFVIDGDMIADNIHSQEAVIGGDATEFSISSASILAKVFRDRLMERIESRYPGYGFATHKGYGTAFHLKSLREKGPCSVHRRTFRPVREHFFTQLEIFSE